MITIESNGKQIVTFGRTEIGTRIIGTVDDFSPYFYYDDKNGNVDTIDGTKANKVICKYPSDIIVERGRYSKTYEADVRYVNRYIIDRVKAFNNDPIRICYLDIEIARTDKGYEDVSIASNPILAICCYDNFDKEYKHFSLMKLTHANERVMLQEFMDYIKNKDPDIIVAWNGDMFDFPFLVNRIKKIGLNPNELSRGGTSYVTEYDTKIYGRIVFDLMKGYKKITSGGRESWSLEYISNYEKIGEKEKYKGELDDLFKNDIEKFLRYNRRDVELLVLLDEKLKIIEFFNEVRKLCFCRFEDVFMNSKIADCLCLRYAKEHNFVLPTSNPVPKVKFKGAFVKNSEPKLHENIAVMDMKSLYPSIMLGFNTSYETLLSKYETGTSVLDGTIINMYDTYYYSKKRGIIPSIVKPLLDKRTEVITEMKKYDIESEEYESLWMSQYALKVIANSFYGVLGYETFRLYKRDVAQSITFCAQNIIKEVHKWFEEKGMKVIYGDTDSCFIVMGDKTINDMIELKKEINKYFKDYFKQFSVDDEYNIFKLEFEKVYKTILFKLKGDGTGAKKKYAGWMCWYDGHGVDKIAITGFESVRSDSPQIGRDLMKNVLEMILKKTEKEKIDNYINMFKSNIRGGMYQPEEIALPISITKNLDKYGNQIHARAARKANELHKSNIKSGDKIKYVYLKKGDVIAFKNYLWDGYEIDYDKMIRRIVDLKIGPIYEGLGWEYKYLILEKKKKEKEVLIEDRLKQIGLWN